MSNLWRKFVLSPVVFKIVNFRLPLLSLKVNIYCPFFQGSVNPRKSSIAITIAIIKTGFMTFRILRYPKNISRRKRNFGFIPATYTL